MKKKKIAMLMALLLVLYSSCALAASKSGALIGKVNNISLNGFDVEFVSAYVTEKDTHVELKAFFQSEDEAEKYGFHTILLDDPFYIQVWVHWLDEHGETLDYNKGDWSLETKPASKETDGRWSIQILFDVKGWVPESNTIMLTLEEYNPFTQEHSPLADEGKMVIGFS